MGTLVRVRQGVVVGAEFWPSDPAGQHLVRAQAEVAANPGAVLSHQSAALAWGLPTPGFSPWTDLPVSVTLSPSGHSSHAVPAVHHLLGLPSGHVQRHRLGYAVTSPARTAVDLTAGLELPAALAILDGAARVICASMVPSIRRRDYSNPRLARAAVELLEEAADSTGAARLAQAIGLVDPARESAPESVSAGHVFLSGLPMPTFQTEISTPLGTYFADCLWEEQRLIGECDGAMKYDDPQAYVKEKRREQICETPTSASCAGRQPSPSCGRTGCLVGSNALSVSRSSEVVAIHGASVRIGRGSSVVVVKRLHRGRMTTTSGYAARPPSGKPQMATISGE